MTRKLEETQRMSTYGNTMSDDDIRAMGLDPEDVRRGAELHAQRTATQQEKAEAREFLDRAQEARYSGEFSDAQIAEALAEASPLAHEAFVSLWYEEDHQFDAEEQQDELAFQSADEYLARAAAAQEQRQEAERLAAEAQANVTAEEEVAKVAKELDRYLTTTPHAHEDAARVRALVAQSVIEQAGVPETDDGKRKLVEQTHRLLGIADTTLATATEQARVEHRYREKHRVDTNLSSHRSDDRTVREREADSAAWIANRVNELTGDAVAAGVSESVLNPPTAADETAALVERYKAKSNQRLNREVPDTEKPYEHGDLDNKKRFRQLSKQAEERATFGEPRTATDGVPAKWKPMSFDEATMVQPNE